MNYGQFYLDRVDSFLEGLGFEEADQWVLSNEPSGSYAQSSNLWLDRAQLEDMAVALASGRAQHWGYCRNRIRCSTGEGVIEWCDDIVARADFGIRVEEIPKLIEAIREQLNEYPAPIVEHSEPAPTGPGFVPWKTSL